MTLPNILPEWKDSIKNTKKNLENIAGKYFGVECDRDRNGNNSPMGMP